MAEHLIRLRGAWQREGASPGRIDLPTTWPAHLESPLILSRRFRRPRIDPAAESLLLRLEAVPGLRVVRLNGRDIARPAPGASSLELVPDGPLPESNQLVLEIDPTAAGQGPWGTIALVIRPS